MTAPERGVGRTLVHPGGVEVNDAQALAVLCNLRDLLPLSDADLAPCIREHGDGFGIGALAFLACLDKAIGIHAASIAVEDAALDAEGAEG